jgi:hypothetical protein
MNLKSISILCSAFLGLAILAPQAQARDHRRDDDRRDRYEYRDRRDSDRDPYSRDRGCDDRHRHYDRRDDDRHHHHRHHHHSHGERIFSFLFGR